MMLLFFVHEYDFIPAAAASNRRDIFHSRLLCYPRNSDNGSTRSGCIPSKRAWAITPTRSSAAEGESCPFETAKKTAVSSTNETKGLDGVLLEASTKKLALLDYNRKSLFGNVKLSKCTRGQYKSMMHQLQKFCIRTADYSTLMILQLNAPLVSPFYVRISSSVSGIVDPSFPQTHVQLLSLFLVYRTLLQWMLTHLPFSSNSNLVRKVAYLWISMVSKFLTLRGVQFCLKVQSPSTTNATIFVGLGELGRM